MLENNIEEKWKVHEFRWEVYKNIRKSLLIESFWCRFHIRKGVKVLDLCGC